MADVVVALTMSLDGYIAGPNDGLQAPLGEGGPALFDWFFTGDTPSRFYDRFRMSARSAEVFDAGVERLGAVITGRRTYDISRAWGGEGPAPGKPLFILTHRPPADAPVTSVPYTYVTDGITSAVRKAKAAAGGGDVSLMGSSPVQQCLREGLLDRIDIALAPLLLGGGVRLFDHTGGPVPLQTVRVLEAPGVTHLSYRVAGH